MMALLKEGCDRLMVTPLRAFGEELEEVTAGSGYCSEKNLRYLKVKGILYPKIRLQNEKQALDYAESVLHVLHQAMEKIYGPLFNFRLMNH